MSDLETVIQRRNVYSNPSSSNLDSDKNDDFSKSFDEFGDPLSLKINDEELDNSKETRLTLMEEILLLGLKEREGYTSFWNDSLSAGLRGAILIELGLRGRISLEPGGARRRGLHTRRVVLKSDQLVGDVLLDETLQIIRDNEQANVRTWIDYLSGETWNPLKLKLQLRYVRQRLAKNLTEKGVCTTEKQNYVVFDMTTHPLVDGGTKQKLVRKLQDSLLSRWCNDPFKWDKRLLSLIVISHFSDVLENALHLLSDEEYDMAMRRVRELCELDYDESALKDSSSSVGADVMWAVFASFAN